MKIFIFLLAISLNIFALESYKPSADFSSYFNNINCSQILDKFFYLNCYDYKLKGTKAVAYKVEASNLKEQSKNALALKMIQIFLKNTALLGVIIKTVVTHEDTLRLMLLLALVKLLKIQYF